MNYYNEYDDGAAAWLRELINQNLIPYGHVDTRSIAEVKPDGLKGYTQCHFFAGIGGWSYALQLAGWPADRPVWTGSCPCQPFSVAGKGRGTADERHLWPVFFNLIRECRPEHVFGEQVASAIGHGWLDGVSSDLEAEGYACGATVLGAHSVGAPHIRQRLFWVAYSNDKGLEKRQEQSAREERQTIERSGDAGGMADSDCQRCDGEHSLLRQNESGRHQRSVFETAWSGQTIQCRDGKTRRIPSEPALFPLADGLPGRVGLLRGAGNAIVPQVAAEFIAAFLDCQGTQSEQTEEWV